MCRATTSSSRCRDRRVRRDASQRTLRAFTCFDRRSSQTSGPGETAVEGRIPMRRRSPLRIGNRPCYNHLDGLVPRTRAARPRIEPRRDTIHRADGWPPRRPSRTDRAARLTAPRIRAIELDAWDLPPACRMQGIIPAGESLTRRASITPARRRAPVLSGSGTDPSDPPLRPRAWTLPRRRRAPGLIPRVPQIGHARRLAGRSETMESARQSWPPGTSASRRSAGS